MYTDWVTAAVETVKDSFPLKVMAMDAINNLHGGNYGV